MDRPTQIRLVTQLLEGIESKTTGLGPAETCHPVQEYYDRELFDHEMVGIYRRSPLIIGHASQVARPGDFISETICNIPVVVIRSDAGDIRAFVNVCRHRGAKLVTESFGSKLTKFVCPYHAWSYDSDGRLTHVPDRTRSFPGIDCEARSLVTLPVAIRNGFIWVALRPGHVAHDWATTVGDYLGPLDAELESYRFDDYVYYRSDDAVRAFNWKLGMEGFAENYHFAVLHRASTNPIFVHNMLSVEPLGHHIRITAPKRTLAQLAAVPEAQWDLRPNATILYSIFPNSCLFLEKNFFSLLRFLPEDEGHCRIRILYAVAKDSLRLRAHYEENIKLFMAAALEDFDMYESIQSAVRSGANDSVVFGRNELGCELFRRAVREALRAE